MYHSPVKFTFFFQNAIRPDNRKSVKLFVEICSFNSCVILAIYIKRLVYYQSLVCLMPKRFKIVIYGAEKKRRNSIVLLPSRIWQRTKSYLLSMALWDFDWKRATLTSAYCISNTTRTILNSQHYKKKERKKKEKCIIPRKCAPSLKPVKPLMQSRRIFGFKCCDSVQKEPYRPSFLASDLLGIFDYLAVKAKDVSIQNWKRLNLTSTYRRQEITLLKPISITHYLINIFF